MTVLWWVLGVAAFAWLVWAAVLSSARVRRLHRLHIRTDAARDALESALDRRAVVAAAVAAVLDGTADQALDPAADRAGALRAAVTAARVARASGGDREAAENVLGRALGAVDRARLPPAVFEELVDAEQLLILARRVHNDAVRDTLALRSRRLVRWLHLAGTAPMPAYFEIADADPGVTTAASGWPRDTRWSLPADVPSGGSAAVDER